METPLAKTNNPFDCIINCSILKAEIIFGNGEVNTCLARFWVGKMKNGSKLSRMLLGD